MAAIIIEAIERAQLALRNGDIFVVAQKIVSKAQGRYVDLSSVVPSPRAKEVATAVGKDPRLVEVILSESRQVLRQAPNVLIVEHRLGFIMADAGIDRSNVPEKPDGELVLLLPEDPDGSADALRARFVAHFGKQFALIINDSFGRPWRKGNVGVAIGAAGLPALRDLRGQPDLFGRPLRVTETGFADELAAGASLLMGQANEGYPVVVASGFELAELPNSAQTLIRPAAEDLFR